MNLVSHGTIDNKP